MRPDTVTKAVKHTFDNGELLTMADAITESVQRLAEVRKAKAEADASFKDEMEQQTGTITKLSGMYRRGYEFRDAECKVLYNSPEVGEKTFVRIDTGEEKQETLPLETVGARITEAGDV